MEVNEVWEKMYRYWFITLITIAFMIFHPSKGHPDSSIPKISNLKISPNPTNYEEDVWIVFEFEDQDADVDKFFIENSWETKAGKIESKVHQYNLPTDVQDKPKGEIKKRWMVKSREQKDYRILKIWVRDRKDNQSNILSEQLKLTREKVISPTDLPERCEAPIWNVGDRWTYRTSSGKNWTIEVVDDKEDISIMKVGKEKIGYDKNTLNEKFIIDEKGNKIRSPYWGRKLFNFPIFIGKNWTDITTANGDNYLNEFKFIGVDEIDTPAGTFKGYKIYCKHTNMSNTTFTGHAIYWYSPQVKNWIKREFDNRTVLRAFEDAVILRFKLK